MPTNQAKCTVPPAGWVCTRAGGHKGPCAAIQATYFDLAPETPLTEALVLSLGFVHEDLGDDPPYDQFRYGEIAIWEQNDDSWLVDALDQAGIDMDFTTLGQLDAFFRACGKNGFITQ